MAFLSPNQKTKTLSITFVQEGAETLYPSRMATDNTKKVKNQEKLLGCHRENHKGWVLGGYQVRKSLLIGRQGEGQYAIRRQGCPLSVWIPLTLSHRGRERASRRIRGVIY